VSKTEQDVESSLDDDAREELGAGERDATDGSDDDVNSDESERFDEAELADDEAELADESADDVVEIVDSGDVADDDLDVDGDVLVDDAAAADGVDLSDVGEAFGRSLGDLFEDDEFSDDDFDDDGRTFDIPKIVLADESDDGSADESTDADAKGTPTTDEPESPDVSDDILEELRRADIDGPVVDLAPQDDETGGRRRPKKPVDFDPAPVPVPLRVPRILGRKPRVRKVTRVVRHVDPWSVFKIAIIANLVLYLIVLTAGVLLWNVAYATGTVENVERFFESFGWQSFEFNGGEIYHSAWIAGLFAVLGLTGLAVLMATLFNLITDLVGGVRFTVLEEEVVEARTSPMRRFVVRRTEPAIPATMSDESGSIIREAVVDDSGARTL
jgi:hypothetical protein